VFKYQQMQVGVKPVVRVQCSVRFKFWNYDNLTVTYRMKTLKKSQIMSVHNY